MANKLFLVLGCNGNTVNNFISCASTENAILELHPQLENIQEIIAYFRGLRLFEMKLKDYNAVRHVLFNIKDKYYQNCKPIWDDAYFKLLEKFTINHKECGIYLGLAKVE